MGAMRFKIKKKVYTTSAVNEISLRHLIVFNNQAADMGIKERWADVELLAAQFSDMTPEECEAHEARWLVLGVTIWATRRIAGEEITFEEAVDIKMSDLTFLPDVATPQDRKPGKAKGRKTARPKASAPAAEPDTDEQATPTTSPEKSTSD